MPVGAESGFDLSLGHKSFKKTSFRRAAAGAPDLVGAHKCGLAQYAYFSQRGPSVGGAIMKPCKQDNQIVRTATGERDCIVIGHVPDLVGKRREFVTQLGGRLGEPALGKGNVHV